MFRLRRPTRLQCSFCRKADLEVSKLIAGPAVYICDACIGLCNRILDGQPTPGFAGWESLTDEQLLECLAPSLASVDGACAVLQGQVDILRKREVSWARIGEALDISRQAAWERFS